jgi:hypothetical protein
MEQNDLDKTYELLQLPKYLRLSDFENYVARYLERKADKRMAIEELDRTITLLQSHILSFSIYLKQNHLVKQTGSNNNQDTEFFTKQEVAMKYRVSVRTVSNWIIDGLQAEEIGGVVRISSFALKTFVSANKRKKFTWKSIKQM